MYNGLCKRESAVWESEREDIRIKESSERTDDAVLLALKTEEEAVTQGLQVTSGRWKRQGTGFLPLEGVQPDRKSVV